MKIINYLFVLSFLILFASCDSQLDLEPEQSISEDLALSNDANVKAVLIGAYDELGVGNLYGGEVQRNAELLGGDGEVLWAGTFLAPREIFLKRMVVDNGDVSGIWIDGYQTINIANNVLSAIDVVFDADKGQVTGEALFIRAAVYFELVRVFGRQFEAGQSNDQLGVPLVLEPTRSISEASFVSRTTVGAVYNQIVADLTEAASLLGESPGFRANKHAANALLARVYLQMGDFANARDAASSVIESGAYSLVSSYSDVFNRGIDPGSGGNQSNTSEDIFAMQVSSQDGTNSMNTFFSVPAFGGRDGDVEIEQGHLDLYEDGDTRKDLFFENAGAMFSGKWNNRNGNVGIIRLAEMYLIRAETNLRLGTVTGATPLDDYNQTRTRAGLAAATAVTLDDILLERRLELAHEGFKIHDARRLGSTIGGADPNGDTFIYPIPLRETEANDNLVQNPGY